jgi:hypothetical protein
MDEPVADLGLRTDTMGHSSDSAGERKFPMGTMMQTSRNTFASVFA